MRTAEWRQQRKPATKNHANSAEEQEVAVHGRGIDVELSDEGSEIVEHDSDIVVDESKPEEHVSTGCFGGQLSWKKK